MGCLAGILTIQILCFFEILFLLLDLLFLLYLCSILSLFYERAFQHSVLWFVQGILELILNGKESDRGDSMI